MSDENSGCGSMLLLIVVFFFGAWMGNEAIRQDAVKHGAARYVVDADGNKTFEWIKQADAAGAER